MAKNAKKNRARALRKTAQKGTGRREHAPEMQKTSDFPVEPVVSPSSSDGSHSNAHGELWQPMALHTRMGILDDEIYSQLIEPAFLAFALDDDETGLRMLAESVVSAIAAREDYSKFRKLDDICQRYLYYIESYTELKRRTRERVEIQGLCTYWRSQMCMAFVCDSHAMRRLLLPDEKVRSPGDGVEQELGSSVRRPEENRRIMGDDAHGGFDMPQERFLRGIDAVLRMTPASGFCADREGALCRDVFHFAYGMSFPWIGFDPDRIFNLKHIVFDEALCVSHCFARLDVAHVGVMWQRLKECLSEALFIDLLYAQHRRLYDEIHEVFDDGRIPCDFLELVQRRVRFDKAYQTAYDDIVRGEPLLRPLHRSSRLALGDLNAFAALSAIWSKAASARQALYAFHYFG